MKSQTNANPELKGKKSLSPWFWVPTLYFLEGIPYFLVNNLSMAMFTNMGVPNGEMSFFTTLLYFPWALKFLWAPFVDLIKTKRWWFLVMQIIMFALTVLTILSIPHPDPTTIAAMSTEVTLFTGVLIAFIIMAFASATHDIAADGFYMLALTPGVQAEMIGWRSVFYRLSNVFCNSALIAIPGFIYDYTVEQGQANMPLAWQITMGITAVIFIIMAIWHIFFTPRPDSDKPNGETSAKKIIADFGLAFSTFVKKQGLWVAILFMLLYRLPEAFLLKMLYPFLFGTREMGGLAMSNQEFALIYGTLGVVFLLIGGILGGFIISRIGLKKSFWWMALAMTLPCLTFVYLSEFLPTSMVSIGIAIAIEQIGYGFGFTAYMMYMMYFSDGEYKTSHYAICTSFMALSMIIPGMFAGYIQEASSPVQKTIQYTHNDSTAFAAPLGYDKDSLFFNGWATVSVDSANNIVEELYAKPTDSIVITGSKNLFASFSTMKFIRHQVQYDTLPNIENNTIGYSITSDTVTAPINVKQYKNEQKAANKQKYYVKSPLGTITIQQRIKLDTIKTLIPLTEMYPIEELQKGSIVQSTDSIHDIQFLTAQGKMSDYRWFFWMVICCSAATFFVTFLAWRRVTPTYGKK
ncbi:MAG: MFS transporter [Bacteroidales bacterium]|nr:MFS transporter [Bacteroidales bacterium]